MSEQTKKEFQTPYEEYRVKAGYTRESASVFHQTKYIELKKANKLQNQTLFYN